MKYDMKIFICFSCAITSIPTNTKPTLSGWSQREDIIKKKGSPQYLLSWQSYVLFSKSEMTFDLKNPRWPPSAAILDFKNLDISLQRKQISAWSFFKMISVLLALISIICGCHLGRAYMSGSRRENAYVNFDLHKKN